MQDAAETFLGYAGDKGEWSAVDVTHIGGGSGGLMIPMTSSGIASTFWPGGAGTPNVLWQNTSSNASYSSASKALKIT